MSFFNSYSKKTINYDLINVFFYNKLTQIPQLKQITLSFGYKQSLLKFILPGLIALEFITLKKSSITKSKRLNVFLKIKKGAPIGCKVILKKENMYFFYLKLITLTSLKTVQFKKKIDSFKAITFQIQNPLFFNELENQYMYFKNLPKLTITLNFNTKSQKELYFILKSNKFFV